MIRALKKINDQLNAMNDLNSVLMQDINGEISIETMIQPSENDKINDEFLSIMGNP